MISILQGDWIDQLRTLADESVHCCVTSPPYDNLRTYGGNEVWWNFEPGARELFRVMVPGGVVCWNVGDQVVKGSETLSSMRQALYFVDDVGFRMHDTMIWNKLNFANPETVRYHQVFEYVFILSKGKPRVFNPLRDKPNSTAGRIGCLGTNSYAKRDGSRSVRAQTFVTQDLGMRGNVWVGKTRGQEEFCAELPHPAMMPKWLARDLILSWSNPGDTVLDPMAGSGTVPAEAVSLARNAIAIELNPEYVKLIKQRTNITPGLPLH